MTTPETELKSNVKHLFEVFHVFNFPIFQGLGAYKGIPDRIAHVNGRVHYLEFKAPKGKLTENQETFREQCMVDGIAYHVIRSLDDATLLVNEWRGE